MRILYVCTGNSFRSVVAEALSRRFRPGLEVESAGIHPTDHIAENAKELLKYEHAEKHVKPSPDRISKRAIDEADLVIAMMPEHRSFILNNFDVDEDKLRVWHVFDPIKPEVEPMESFIKIREKIRTI